MATPKAQEAAEYVEKHHIVELMNNLTSSLFFFRPEDPKEYIIRYLGQLNESKESVGASCLFNDSNLDSVCGILDPANQGYVTYPQYMQVLIALGVTQMNQAPEGAGHDRISRETLKKEAGEGLRRSSARYAAS